MISVYIRSSHETNNKVIPIGFVAVSFYGKINSCFFSFLLLPLYFATFIILLPADSNEIIGIPTQFLGSETPFFHDNPDAFSYQPKSSLITFVWEELHAMNGTLSSDKWWLPTTAYQSGPPIIMTTLLAAQRRACNTPHAISDKAIRHANLVQLYLRVTFLSDILTADMTTIADWALHATQQRPTIEKYTNQAPPSNQMLKQWQTVLRQSFIRTGQTLNVHPSQPQPPPTEQHLDLTFRSFLSNALKR